MYHDVQRRPFPTLIVSLKVKCTVPSDILVLPQLPPSPLPTPLNYVLRKRTGVPPTIETAKPEQARPTTRGSPQIPVPIPHCKGVAVLRVQKTKTPSSWQEAKADVWGRKWKRQYQLLQNCTGLKGKASALGGQGSSWVTRARILTSLSFSLF